MAKFSIEYENGTKIEKLTFRGKTFINTWMPWKNGKRKTIETDFEDQLSKEYKDDENIKDIVAAVEDLDSNDDDSVEEMIERLEELE